MRDQPPSLPTPEDAIEDPIIAGNLTMMLSSEMQRVIIDQESVGGNTSIVSIGRDEDRFGASSVNGYADPQTGRIVEFGVQQSSQLTAEEAARYARFSYIVAMPDIARLAPVMSDPEGHSVDIARYNEGRVLRLTTPDTNISEEAMWRLRESAKYYNDVWNGNRDHLQL